MSSARLWTIAILGLLGSIGVLNVILFAAASSTPAALVVERPYDESINFDRKLAALRLPAAAGLKHTFTIGELDSEGYARIGLHVQGADGAPVRGLQIVCRALRPSSPELDTASHLKETEPGRYSEVLRLSSAGFWYFYLSFRIGDNDALLERSEMVRLRQPNR